ncbi:MAG: putative small heat-shock protein [Burkholderiaceae bacterium]|nr:putative small heat-shock protein [Burkholderiaceae bacterium]
MKLDEIKQGFNSFLDSVTDGWQRLRQSAAGALIRFQPGENANLPEKSQVDDDFYLASQGWAMLGGDVFEDERRLVVRIEAPGMEKENFVVEVKDNALVIHGEKRFEREATEGRWRVLQCAYGSFSRVVPLHVPVMADKASAAYRNGVLRVELPKVEPGQPRGRTIRVD